MTNQQDIDNDAAFSYIKVEEIKDDNLENGVNVIRSRSGGKCGKFWFQLILIS
jgi:hypothetical protein